MSLSEIIGLLGGENTWVGRQAENLQSGIDEFNSGPISSALTSAGNWARDEVNQFNPFDEGSNLRWGVRTLRHMTPGEATGAMLDETINSPLGLAVPAVASMAHPAAGAVLGGLEAGVGRFAGQAGPNAMRKALARMAAEKYGGRAEDIDVEGMLSDSKVADHLSASTESDGTVSAKKFGREDFKNLIDYTRAKRQGKMPGMDTFQVGPDDSLPDMVGGTFSKASKGTAARASQRYENALMPFGAGMPNSGQVGSLAMGLGKQRTELEKNYRRALVADDPAGQAILAQWGLDPKSASNPKNLPQIRRMMDQQVVSDLRSMVPDPKMWRAVAPMLAVGLNDTGESVSRDTNVKGQESGKAAAPAAESGWDYAKDAAIGAAVALGTGYLLKKAGGKLFPNSKVAPSGGGGTPPPTAPGAPTGSAPGSFGGPTAASAWADKKDLADMFAPVQNLRKSMLLKEASDAGNDGAMRRASAEVMNKLRSGMVQRELENAADDQAMRGARAEVMNRLRAAPSAGKSMTNESAREFYGDIFDRLRK